MLLSMIGNPEVERLNKLVGTIATLQDTIDAKTEMVNAMSDRIKQLENQLGK